MCVVCRSNFPTGFSLSVFLVATKVTRLQNSEADTLRTPSYNYGHA